MIRTRTSYRSKPQVRPTLSKPQYEIYRHGWLPEARFRTAVCGRRFGKTFLAVEEIRRAIRLAVKLDVSVENEIWYGAPTFRQAKRVFWRRLKKGIPPEWIAGKPNETDCSMTMKSGHVVRCVGLNEYDNLRGSGLWFFLGDEWQDAPPEAWAETIRPMLSTAGGHALWIGTPKGFNHFRDCYLAGQPGATDGDKNPITDNKSFIYTTIQGGNVPPEEIAQARATLAPRVYKQEYEATFESFEGRVLYAFNRALHSMPCKDKLTPHCKIAIGIDFNVNPMSGVVIVETPEADYQVDEIVLKTSNTDEMVAEIKARYARNGSLSHITAYPDPAGAQRRTSAQGRTDIGILQASGMNVLAMASHPLVRDRNNVTNARFETADGKRRLFVDPTCKASAEAYEKHVYKDGSSEPDKKSGFDHIPDALAYWAFGRYAYKPPVATRVNFMGR